MHSTQASGWLPPELLWPIADNLCKDDCVQCALVCKAWRSIFQAKLRQDLHFTRKRRLIKYLMKLEHDSDNDSNKGTLGELTQKLYLDDRIRLTRKDMDYLADMLPNLRSLEFNPSLWSELGYDKAFKRWKRLRHLPRLTDELVATAIMDDMGHRLVELTLSFALAIELHSKRKLLPMLKQAPCAKIFRMDIAEFELDEPKELCLTLDEFVALFRAMPQLTEFSSYDLKLLDISPDANLQSIHPTEVQDLTLHCAFKDIRWTTVLSALYPKVHSVTLSIRLIADQEDQEHGQQQPNAIDEEETARLRARADSYNREMLLHMITSFTKLRSLVLDGFWPETARILPPEHLMAALKLAGRQLQNLNYFYQEIYDHRSPRQFLDIMDRQTEEISISTKIRRVPLYDFLNPLSQHFHRLTYLSLYLAYPRTIVNVSMTLTLFPSLHTLNLWNCTLESGDNVGKGVSSFEKQHPLENLTLKLVDILNPNMWDLLAQSCPQLSNLTLGTCTVHLEHDDIPFSMHFNFPQHTLDTVEIYTLNFFRRYRPISKLGRGPARLLSVVSNAKIEHTEERRRRRRKKQQNEDVEDLDIKEERWYHQYRDDSDYVDQSKGLRVKRLSHYSGDEIKAFCSNIDAQLLFFDPLPYDSAAPFSKNEWRRALPNGYVKITSRNIKRIVFNHVHIHYK